MTVALKLETPAVVQDSRSERKPNSKLPSTKAAGEYTAANETTTGLERALAAMKRLQAGTGFDPDDFVRWRAEGFAIDFGITYGEAVRLCRETTPRQQASNWNFVWHAGLNIAHTKGNLTLRGFKVGLVLFEFSNARHPYVWPGRRTIIERIGWSTTNRQGVLDGLNELDAIGAIRRIKFKDLPLDILETAKAEGQKFSRDPRTLAYALNPPTDWKEVDKPEGFRRRSA